MTHKISNAVVSISKREYSDQELVAGLKQRDRAVTSAFYDRFSKRINRLVWRLLGSDAEHDDVVQQAFVSVFAGIRGLKDESALTDWVNAITVNTVRREIRSRKYRRIVKATPDNQIQEAQVVNKNEQLLSFHFYSLIRQLSADDQILVTLRFVEGLTLEEISKIRGYSLATSKRKINRAKKAFVNLAKQNLVLASMIEEIANGQ